MASNYIVIGRREFASPIFMENLKNEEPLSELLV
jgi:hypothetical protein